MSGRGEPTGFIRPVVPTPSILTTARDRSTDDFGNTPIPPGPDGPGEPAPTSSWRTGVQYSSRACQQSFAWWICPDPDHDRNPDLDAGGVMSSDPFWLYTPVACEWTTTEADLARYARELNEAHVAWGLAKALWMGEGLDPANTGQPTLRRLATDIGAAGTTPLDQAVALLLAAYEIATGGSGGAVIHLPGVLVTAALGGGNGGSAVMRPEGNTYRGPNGSLVSPGPGYPMGATTEGPDGAGPLVDDDPAEVYAGNDSDELWVYVSGPVEYALGPPEDLEPDADSHLRRNTVERWSQRQAIYRLDDCPVFAVLVESPVDLDDPMFSGGS